MEKKMMFGMAALALLAVAALSVVSTYAYPSALATLASASGYCDQDMLQTRLQTQDRDCNGTCNGTMAQSRAQAQICQNDGTECSGDQYRLMQQSHEGLGLEEQTKQSTLQARNQIMAQNGNN
jgi:hypothetical protein